MLAVVLAEAGLDPSFIIGGDVNQIGSGAVWSDGEWFVVEADESDGTFVELTTEVAVVTNVEADHHAHYGDFAALRDAFDRFVDGRRRLAVVGHRRRRGRGAGRSATPAPTWSRWARPRTPPTGSSTCVREPRGTTFRLVRRGEDLGELHLPGPRRPQRPQRRGRRGHRPRDRRVVRRRRRGAGPLRRGGPPLRVPGRGRRRGLRRRLRPPADRGRRRPGRRPGHRARSGWSPCSSPTATPGCTPWPTSSAGRSSTPTWWSSPTSTARARPRSPACRAWPWSTPCRNDDPDAPGRVPAPPRGPRRQPGQPAAARRPLPDARAPAT